MPIDLYSIIKDNNHLLPGIEAQNKMAPSYRKRAAVIPEKAVLSAVCILLHQKNGQYYFPLVLRSAKNGHDKHKGQIGFPGGKMEQQDLDLFDCAVRETQEELGVPRKDIQLIRPLSPLYIDVSNFAVFPFLSKSNGNHDYILQESEIEGVINFPLYALFDPDLKRKKDMLIRGKVYPDIPFYQFDNSVIWGATAMILSELEVLLGKYFK